MHHAAFLLFMAAWIAGNLLLWSLKQSHIALFWQGMGMAAIGYPAIYLYVSVFAPVRHCVTRRPMEL